MIAAMFPIKTIEATRVGSCLYCSASMKQSTAGGSAANSKKHSIERGSNPEAASVKSDNQTNQSDTISLQATQS